MLECFDLGGKKKEVREITYIRESSDNKDHFVQWLKTLFRQDSGLQAIPVVNIRQNDDKPNYEHHQFMTKLTTKIIKIGYNGNHRSTSFCHRP